MGLTAYESDDYSSIGSFLGEPLRLVPSETWGEDFMVPADAEILVEGVKPAACPDDRRPVWRHHPAVPGADAAARHERHGDHPS